MLLSLNITNIGEEENDAPGAYTSRFLESCLLLFCAYCLGSGLLAVLKQMQDMVELWRLLYYQQIYSGVVRLASTDCTARKVIMLERDN